MAADEMSFEAARASYVPRIPSILDRADGRPVFNAGAATTALADADEIRSHFSQTYGRPILHLGAESGTTANAVRVGVVLSGGQAPGGHNVIAGLYDGLVALRPDSKLFGFLGGRGASSRDATAS